MDRNKPPASNRGQKKIPSHIGGELFALGAKSSRDDSKSKIIPLKIGTSSSTSDRKREASSSIANPNKRLRLSFKDSGHTISGVVGHYELWEQFAKDCDPTELVGTIYGAIDQNDNDLIIQLICGSLKYFTSTNFKNKADPVPFLAIIYLSKLSPNIFCNEVVTGALLSMLRRDLNAKFRYSSNIHILATNLLTKGFIERTQWPEIFLRTYIDDAVNERFWSDNDYCTPFANNICAAFKTLIPSLNILRSDPNTNTVSTQSNRELNLNIDDDSSDILIQSMDSNLSATTEFEQLTPSICETQKRFSDAVIENYVIDAIKDQLNKRQQQDNYTKNFLKFLSTTSGLAEVRYLCISRLELWIHNGKLVKFAQQLLSYICFNIRENSPKDFEVLGVLVKMRLKTKPLINHYMSCLKEIIKLHPRILNIILKLVVQNELSNTRNPNNMGIIATMFQTLPEQSASNLAEIYQEFLLQREDCLRTLRVFLRELIRMLRFDVNIAKFCKVFLCEREDIIQQINASEFKERIFHSTVDLVCLCMLLSVTPQLREAYMTLKTSRDCKNTDIMIKFYNQISQIQLDAVSWMYETVPNVFKMPAADYNQALHKLLLLDNPEQYSRSDQWPSDPERGTLLRIISETPIHEETLLRIILIGITKDIPFTICDTFDIILQVIKRVSAMKNTNWPAVQANKFDIIDFLFSMSEYHHPENIILPSQYDPPKLAIILYYWKAWLILLMISAQNPSTFGAFCWDHYPTMKMLIEMCITNQFNINASSKDELQILAVEKDHILQYETYLAAHTTPQAVITEENALLISQLMLMDPMGAARKIPSVVLDQIKFINETYKLGHLFCRCRKPDLLLDIIQRQGTTQSMPWLSDLVQNSEGDLNHLPVQCLCEFLLFNAHNINEENSRDAELVDFLRNLLIDPNSNKQTVCEVVDYIFRRLSSTVKHSRVSALVGIRIMFRNFDQHENGWLLKSLPLIPHFMEARAFIIPQLRAACQVENSAVLVMAYIQFIAAHTLDDPVNEMLDHVIDMAQLIVERSTMFQHIVISPENCVNAEDENRIRTLECLFVMFNNYIIKLREYNQPYEWTEYPDLLMVQFDDGVQLPLHINIIHAFIILLTYSSSSMSESVPILDYWFPPGRPAPLAFLPNMPRDPVQLLPDWLKLKMIRSPVERLIEAALHDLTPDQIVLFVQNFGTPVNSMSKLLALLDTAVLEQCEAVKNAILNKAYLAQLIEIQQARGAKNGHYTVRALELHSHSQTVPDLPKLQIKMLEETQIENYLPVVDMQTSTDYKESKRIEEDVQILLKSPQFNVYGNYRYRHLMHNLLNGKDSILSNKVTQCFLHKFESENELIKNDAMLLNRHTFTFLRVILSMLKPSDCHQTTDKLIEFFKERKDLTHNMDTLFLIVNSPKQLQQTNQTKDKANAYQKRKIIKEMIRNFSDVAKNDEFNIQDSKLLCHNGLFIDWLAEVDPEIISTKTFDIKLLFSKKCSEFRFCLLSLINHQTNWHTIVDISHYLFEKTHLQFDYSTVLHFFEALTNNPKLWKGRDKCVAKCNQPNTVFILTEQELKPFTDYILYEGVAEIDSDSSNYDYKLCSRMNLLFRITKKDKFAMVKFAENVNNNLCSEAIKLQVLQQLYIMCPSIKFLNLNKDCGQIYKYQTLKGCQADKVSNYLITCLGSLVTKKDFETLSSDTELLIRKLAASHPTLFLRQLNVMSSFIQGRAQNAIKALREEHHFHRFVQILRALELLQPMIFEDTFKNEFQSTLTSYFKFFKHHSSVKEAYQVLIKFVQVLQSYININPSSALLFIEQYVGILMELSAKYHSISTLQQLVQAIALLQYKSVTLNELDEDDTKHEFELEDSNDAKLQKLTVNADIDQSEANTNTTQIDIGSKGGFSLVMTSTCNRFNTSSVSPHFLNLIKIIKMSNVEEVILGPLQEIECLTSKRFSFLNDLFNRLLDLIFSPSAQIRSIAFIILIRHLKHNPGHADINKCTLNAYIQCLRDENSSVAATAIDNLCEITLLLQEYAAQILSIAFSLGIRSHLNTSTQIRRVLQTIMLQHGY